MLSQKIGKKIIPYILRHFIYSCGELFRLLLGRTKKYFKNNEKSKFTIIKELINHFIKYREPYIMYYAFGLNQRSRHTNEFITGREILKLKNKTEYYLRRKNNSEKFSYDIILKDKFYASLILEANNIPCIPNIGTIWNNKIFMKNGIEFNLNEIQNFTGNYVIKNTVQESGSGIIVCSILNNRITANGAIVTVDELSNRLKDKTWVIQLVFSSSEAIKKVNSTSLNTTRIVTIFNGEFPIFLGGYQSFATNNQITDGWDKGAVYVGFDLNRECLKPFGFTHPNNPAPGIMFVHPDSKIIFDGYCIPGLNKAIDLCINAHKIFKYHFIIGWDVAITDNGPYIVEANEKPGMNAVQCTNDNVKFIILNCARQIFQH